MNSIQKQQLELVRGSKDRCLIHEADFLCFKKMFKDKKNIVDIGANRGQSIVSFKSMFPDATLHSFEANRLFIPVLDEVSQWYDNVTIYPFGLGKEAGTLDFMVPDVDGIQYLEEGSTRPDAFEKPWVIERLANYGKFLKFNTTCVDIKRADDILKKIPIDIIKIDVEGAEYDVLSGMEEIIKRYVPLFLIENSDWENVTQFLTEKGYVCFQYLAETQKLIRLREACMNSFYIHRSKMDLFPVNIFQA